MVIKLLRNPRISVSNLTPITTASDLPEPALHPEPRLKGLAQAQLFLRFDSVVCQATPSSPGGRLRETPVAEANHSCWRMSTHGRRMSFRRFVPGLLGAH